MKYSLPFFFIVAFSATTVYAMAQNILIEEVRIKQIVRSLSEQSELPPHIIERGVRQAASFWKAEDGTAEEFAVFCEQYYCKTQHEKSLLFHRLCDNFESIFGHHNRIAIDLLMPTHVSGLYASMVDPIFGAYDGLSHFNDDMFHNKLAFVVILNFPYFTLEEKNRDGDQWSDLEWGYARIGDLFTSRVPAAEQQRINTMTADADHYISNYNIIMSSVVDDRNQTYWAADQKLITHWGLRDELKAAYADKMNGLEKQRLIYAVMERIIDQSIPAKLINSNDYTWNPHTNQVFQDRVQVVLAPEENIRYAHLLGIYKAIQASDSYYGKDSDYISRTFNNEYEISVKETEQLFHDLLSSKQVEETAKLISRRLGRKLEPFDIWYDGFKSRSTMDQNKLDATVRTKYPNKVAFEKDLPRMLMELGFSQERADFICKNITVDASVGAGHAWESAMRSDNARLRTRIGENGMDYKGYNIGIHEFGHNVEQVISLHDVPNYFLRGVPNTAFTEALAFIFQSRDMELLGLKEESENDDYLSTLDIFWGCYEIMGVAMVDIKVWQWMYAHPDATPEMLKQAVENVAKEVWNQYYAPVFKVKDQMILAIYSHMIDAPLYLSAYPIGHVIDFQIGQFLKGKNIGEEVERMFKMGKLTPDIWMDRAEGEKLSVEPLLKAVTEATKKIK